MDRQQLRVELELAEWKATRDYDPARGTSLKTHIRNGRRKAALDHHRRECWLPRSLWEKLRDLEARGETVPACLLPPCELTPAWEQEIAAEGTAGETDFPCPGLIPCLRWLARIHPREAYVVGAHYGFGATLVSLAIPLQVSESRIHHLHLQALKHLRQCLTTA